MTTPMSRAEKVAGLILILALVGWAIALVARARTQDWFHRRPHLTFVLDESYRLAEGARVRMSGVTVGSVSTVGLTEGEKVAVTLEILPEHATRLREGLRAVIVPPSLFGETEVSLVPGDGAALLAVGSTIPADVEADVTESVDRLVEKMDILGDDLVAIAGGLREGEGSIGTLLTDRGELHGRLSALMEEARKAVEGLRRLREEATAGIADVREILPQLRSGVDRLDGVLGELPGILEDLKAVLAALSEEEGGLPALLRATTKVLAEVQKGVTMLSEEVPPTAESARHTTADVRRLIRATERNFLIRPYLEPIPAPETTVPGSRRWDPYEE